MCRLVTALVLVVALVSAAAASALRIDLNKANQATAPLKYTLRADATNGLVNVHLELPRKQVPLDHLWRIDVFLKKGGKTVLAVPLETRLVNGVLAADLLLDPSAMPSVEIWIRTGEHAPLAETIYAIDVGSFK